MTRDRGAQVLHSTSVPAGESVLQALDRVAKVKTRFGGRYVRGVDGVEEHGNRAWFYYVNGYLADRSAADYRLRAGDLAWWDYRSWRDPAQDPVVVGAFPQPFLSGYDGKRRPAVVVSTDPRRSRGGAAASRPASPGRARSADANVARAAAASATTIALRGPRPARRSGSPSRATRRLLLRAWPFRYRYEVGG